MTEDINKPVALITGGSHRVGKTIAQYLHKNKFNVVIHYNHSESQAQKLTQNLGKSCVAIKADLLSYKGIQNLIQAAVTHWGRLDVLINNASEFYPTPLETLKEEEWDHLFNLNAKAPFFLSHCAFPHLKKTKGQVINIIDIHAQRPLKNYPIYSASKTALSAVTKSLAKEMAPNVRVNGISPGMILWNALEGDQTAQSKVAQKVPLGRSGTPEDIAQTVLFLYHCGYINGEIINVDGGRSLKQ